MNGMIRIQFGLAPASTEPASCEPSRSLQANNSLPSRPASVLGPLAASSWTSGLSTQAFWLGVGCAHKQDFRKVEAGLRIEIRPNQRGPGRISLACRHDPA